MEGVRKPRLPPLNSLRAFEAAGRLRSFRLAAEELGVTQSAVSHQISALEEALEIALFRRDGRQMTLTEAGMIYLPFVRDAFDRLTSGTRLLTRMGRRSTLFIETYTTVAVRWLIPHLSEIRRSNPDLHFRLGTSQTDWEIVIDHADLGILHTLAPDRAGLRYHQFHKARLCVACAPTLGAAIRGRGSVPDLGGQTCLALVNAPHDWQAWLGAYGVAAQAFSETLEFDTYLTALQAAIDGQGVVAAPDFLVAEDIRTGRLERLAPDAVEQPGAWYVVTREEDAADATTTWFTALIVDRFRQVYG